MFDSRDVAAYIAQKCAERDIYYNNTKIQKLLYCAYGCLLAWKNERICDEYPRAWQYGPVFPKVFKYIYKNREISSYSTRVADSCDASSDIAQTVEKVLDVFGKYPASQLSAWTHKPGSPWDKTVNGYGENDGAGLRGFIPDGYIRDYFRERVLANV